MSKIDWNVYNATRDRPGGPVIINVPDYENSTIEPYRDADGNPTRGGRIGYSIAMLIFIAFFLYFRFAV